MPTTVDNANSTPTISSPFAAPNNKPNNLFKPLNAELLLTALSNNLASNHIAIFISIQTTTADNTIAQ